jgi:predicted Rossmann-fold nucleotide-binding protein
LALLRKVIEIFTWLQLGLHLKPVGLLNVGGFYDLLLQFLAHMRDEQFLTSAHHSMLAVESDADSVLHRLAATQHILIPKPAHHTTSWLAHHRRPQAQG